MFFRASTCAQYPVFMRYNLKNRFATSTGVDSGNTLLIGTDKEKIIKSVFELLDNKEIYNSMIGKMNPYGDGHAAEKIVEIIQKYFIDPNQNQ